MVSSCWPGSLIRTSWTQPSQISLLCVSNLFRVMWRNTRPKYKTKAVEPKDPIWEVLCHFDFVPEHVDHDINERLMKAVADGAIVCNFEVIDLWEALGRLNCCQIVQCIRSCVSFWKMSCWQGASTLPSRSTRTHTAITFWPLTPTGNSSVTFQQAQIVVGLGTVPVFVVIPWLGCILFQAIHPHLLSLLWVIYCITSHTTYYVAHYIKH